MWYISILILLFYDVIPKTHDSYLTVVNYVSGPHWAGWDWQLHGPTAWWNLQRMGLVQTEGIMEFILMFLNWTSILHCLYWFPLMSCSIYKAWSKCHSCGFTCCVQSWSYGEEDSSLPGLSHHYDLFLCCIFSIGWGCDDEGYIIFLTGTTSYLYSLSKWCDIKHYTSSA